MHTRAASLVAFALLAATATVGISTDAHGGGQIEFAGEVCMPADTAVRFVRYDAIPVWWGNDEETVNEGHVPQELLDDCMENGIMVIDGDIVNWVDNPSYEDCIEQLDSWWNDGFLSGDCREMGRQKYWSCMETMETDDPDGWWLEHENLCDRAGEACAFACQQGHPEISC